MGHSSWWTAQHDQAYKALMHASERIGRSEYRAGRYKVVRRRGKVVQGYRLSEDHQRVQETIDDLTRNKITPEEAMAVLHEYDILKARTR